MKRYLILDRDGVINLDSDAYIKSVDEWQPIAGSIEAIAAASKAGWKIVVATNQSGIGRGFYDLATLDAMHIKMHRLVEEQGGSIEAVFFCPHTSDDNCSCRKPLTGLLQQAEQHLNTSLQGCYFVGDSLRDLQCAVAHGCQPVLVKTGKGLSTLRKGLPEQLSSTPVFANLCEFVGQLP